MMRKSECRGVALLLLLGILTAFSPWLCAQTLGRILTLVTRGTTIILEGNVARARNMAITNGKRNALEVAVRELISEDVVFDNYDIINENIYQQHERFIDTYRILSESSRENIYEVNLESTVAIGKLRETFVTLGLIEEESRTEQSRFRLEILGVSCSPCFKALKEYLQNEMEGIEELSLYSISPGRFTLNVAFGGDIETFRDALTSRSFERFRLDPEGIGENQLRVLMVLTQLEDG